VQDELNRALKLPVEDATAEHTFAESAAARAGKLVQFDASGNPIASNTLIADIDMATRKITGLPFAVAGGSPITLDQLSPSGSLAGLPTLVGQSGKYLTTNGVTVFWATIPAIPAQSGGTTNQFLMSNGASAVWSAVPNLVPTTSLDSGISLSWDGTGFGFNREGLNLVFNPNGAINYGTTAMNWTGAMTPAFGNRGWRFETATLTAFSGLFECSSFAYPGSTDIVVTADVDTTLLTGGSVSLVIDFRDGADGSISTTTVPLTAAVSRRFRASATSPASCAKVRVRLVFTAATSTGPLIMRRVKAEAGTVATPFNDAATISWIAGFRQLTEFGRGFTSPIVRVGDATSTSAKHQWRSAAGAQTFDAELAVTGGTSGTDGKGDVSLTSRSFKNSGAIGFAQEFDAGNSGAAITIDFAANGSRQRVTLNAATPAITLATPPVVGNYRLKVIQDGTGGRVPSFAGIPINFANSEGPITQAANGVTFYDFYYDGATAWASWTPWS
jgi:hypothetical protein